MTIKLAPQLPDQEFEWGENMKLYPGALPKELFNVLDKSSFKWIPMEQIWQEYPDTKSITFVRHLESKYNEYKEMIKQTDKYKEFIAMDNSESKKQELAMHLMKNYKEIIWTDYQTQLSEKWKQQWEHLGNLYAKLIESNPSLFPSLIVVSPYLRTRLTAKYFLQNVKWLDLDTEKILSEKSKIDLLTGSFQGKKVIVKLSNDVRERDHGKVLAPNYLREYFDATSPLTAAIADLDESDNEEMHYYTVPNWWESQVQVEQRIKSHLYSLMKDKQDQILVFSHHLAIIAALNTIFSWTFNTHYMLNQYWRPKNGSMTVVSQIPKTQSGQEDKLRVSMYNGMLEDK